LSFQTHQLQQSATTATTTINPCPRFTCVFCFMSYTYRRTFTNMSYAQLCSSVLLLGNIHYSKLYYYAKISVCIRESILFTECFIILRPHTSISKSRIIWPVTDIASNELESPHLVGLSLMLQQRYHHAWRHNSSVGITTCQRPTNSGVVFGWEWVFYSPRSNRPPVIGANTCNMLSPYHCSTYLEVIETSPRIRLSPGWMQWRKLWQE
jgi:hypothetical protein